MWPNTSFLDLVGVDLPIIQAPMAGANGAGMAAAVSKAGGLGSLPCALLDGDEIRAEFAKIRERTSKPVNLNFFCHTPAAPDAAREAAWRKRLEPYYAELGLGPDTQVPAVNRAPFDDAMCAVVEDLEPEVVSFHFGLPETGLLDRVKSAGCKVLSTATTVAEARWLEERGCDAVIAQGFEAGGHRGMFLSQDLTTQAGTMALVPQVVDAVNVPVIAAGGIADGRGIAAAFLLGAAAVQLGTVYLLTPESLIGELHREALRSSNEDQTAVTNVFTGKPARSIVNRVIREVGPITGAAPAFPTAAGALAPLRKAAEAADNTDFTPLWSGQSNRYCQELGAGELTRKLAEYALSQIKS